METPVVFGGAEALDVPGAISQGGWWSRLFGEATSAGFPVNSTSQALESSRVVKSGAGTLFGVSGFNNKASAQFIQVFDLEKIPADGFVPVIVITVPTVANFSIAFGILGRSFARGIVLCNSSTLATKTLGAADCWFDAQYS